MSAGKAVISIGYYEFVVDTDVACKVFCLLNSTSLYKLEGKNVEDAEGKSLWIKYVKPANDQVSMKGVSEEEFAMWKLTGEANG